MQFKMSSASFDCRSNAARIQSERPDWLSNESGRNSEHRRIAYLGISESAYNNNPHNNNRLTRRGGSAAVKFVVLRHINEGIGAILCKDLLLCGPRSDGVTVPGGWGILDSTRFYKRGRRRIRPRDRKNDTRWWIIFMTWRGRSSRILLN